MAKRKIQIIPPDGGYVDVLHPETSADQVIANDGKTLEDKVKDLGGYAVASGTNTYTATVVGVATLTEGLSVKIKFTNANTGASTLNINGLGAKTIVKSNGSALSSGNIKAGQICNLVYGGVNFQLLGEGGEYGTATASDVLSGKTIGTEDGLVIGAMPNNGAQSTTLTTQGASKSIPAGYTTGGIVTASFANLVEGNVRSGVNIGGIIGNLAPLTNEKRWAAGTTTSESSTFKFTLVSGSTLSLFKLIVSGLDFLPSLIVCVSSSSDERITVYQDNSHSGYLYKKTAKVSAYNNGNLGGTNTYNFKADVSPAYVNSSGFSLPVWYNSASFYWIAIE